MTTILFRGKKYPVSFFEDDTIEIVQQQISRSIDIHPDRLFILIGLKLPQDYYMRDPRHWEMLFQRLSLDGTSIKKETFDAYCNDLRYPPVKETFHKMDREEWMQSSGILKDPIKDFIEYRILGVEPIKSYCLPLEFSDIALQIPAAQYPIPEIQKLFSTMYKEPIEQFIVLDNAVEGPYFPLLRSTSPEQLSEVQIKSLEENAVHLKDLLKLDPPKSTSISVLKANWKIDLVDTEFGDAARTRFEQIFYGLTVSKKIPVITFWTSNNEISRHKFFRESGAQQPWIDVPMWKSWLSKTKPAGEKSALILYRGESRENFDRVTIKPYEIIFAAYRNNKNTDDLETLKEKLLSWFQTFDAVVPFIKQSDYMATRFILQEIKFEAFYAQAIQKFDTSRLNCLTGLFEESTRNKSLFRFLRSDHLDDDLNPRELKVMKLLKENRSLNAKDIQKELHIGLYECQLVLDSVNAKLEEDPDLLDKEHPKFPKVEIREKSILIAYVNEMDRYLRYTNILRYILSNPNSKDLDKICPKKMETNQTFSVGTLVDIDETDLFDFLEKEPPKKTEAKEIKTNSGYGYFNDRLKEKNIPLIQNYPKKCEKEYQPVIFTDEELAKISGTPYDPEQYEEKYKLKLENPSGLVVCPEYWCMTDEIPLQESQLEDGSCPICHGKIREVNDTKLDVFEFSVLKRKVGYTIPKFKGNQPNVPCCYKTERSKKLDVEEQGKYYIMNPEKNVASLRLAYVQKSILKSLFINETYEIARSSVNRIQSGMSGYFRVGIERPSIVLPKLLRLQKEVESPHKHIPELLRCAFLATWSKVSTKYADEIEKQLDFDPLINKKLAEIISSISEEFEAGTLNEVFELEYTAIILKTDLFRINLDTETFSCSFFTPQSLNRSRGIIILQLGTKLDCLSYVIRTGKKLKFRSNVFEDPFTEKTVNELLKLRQAACNTTNPTYNTMTLFLHKKHIESYYVILDPFGRAQAFYSPGKFILPFQSTPLPPTKATILKGFDKVEDLPSYSTTLEILEEAGYEYSEDIHDGENVVEVVTSTGLRVPVKPFKKQGENSEVFSHLLTQKESELTFAEPSQEDLETYKKISYNSEIHEFLIFQLSRDLDEYPELKYALIKNKSLEHLLYNWFEETTHFMDVKAPIEFLSKIRKPCGQLTKNTCNSSHMCAWAGKCKIQIRDTFSKPKVFQKLLRTLSDNSKIRSLVIDGRTTPFFSTILYLELPNELIVTDREIKQFTQTEP